MCLVYLSFFSKRIRIHSLCILLCLGILLSSCSLGLSGIREQSGDYLDRDLKMGTAEFKEKLIPVDSANRTKKRKEEPAIPEVSDILTTPKPPEIGPEKLISLSVTGDVPIRDVLIELGRLADVDMEIDSGITGGVIFSVKDKPFSQVIDRISQLADLRFENKGGILRVERDLPYIQNYKVDFLNIVRSNTGSVSINTKVLDSGDSGNDALSSGSTNAITSQYDGDLWKSIETTLQSIIAYQPTTRSQKPLTIADGGANAVSPMSFTINKQAGVISVLATQKHHKIMSQYLEDVKKAVSAQVLIEAKIVEVSLDEQYKTGIDWGTLADADSLGLKVTGSFDGGISATSNFVKLSGVDQLTTAVSLTEKFGTSRTLSSPRLHAMNNQQAVLTFAVNQVYFEIGVEEETTGAGTDTEATKVNVSSNRKTVPIGVILTLQPSINLESQEITMNVRPTLSRIASTVNDPGVDIVIARQTTANPITVTSAIPEIEVRELDSVLKLKSGEVMVIGGLMKEVSTNDDNGVPFVNRIPVFGNLFKGVEKISQVIETVIFIKATIIPSSGSEVHPADKNIYQNFTRDPRPLAF